MKRDLLKDLEETGTVIPALSDTIFKRLMMEHKEYLGFILENVIPLTKKEIMEGEFLSNELPSNHLELKSNRLDLVLKVKDYIINIEANREINLSLLTRNEAHFTGMIYKDYSSKSSENKDIFHYQVNFNEKNYLKDELVIILKYYDKKLNIGEEKFVKIHLNMEIVNQKYYNKEKLNDFEKALILLVLRKVEEIEKIVKGDRLLENVGRDIISYSRAREIVDAYENEVIEENYRRGLIKEAQERALREGRTEGLKQGLEQGIIQNRIEIAKLMLEDKVSIDKISEYTNLSIEEINNLK